MQNQQGCHFNQPTYLCHPQQGAQTLAAQQKYPALCTAVCLHGPPLCSGMFRCSGPLRFVSRMRVLAFLLSETITRECVHLIKTVGEWMSL